MSSVKFPAWVKRKHSHQVLPPMSGGKLRFEWYLFDYNYFPGVALSSITKQSKVSRPFPSYFEPLYEIKATCLLCYESECSAVSK